MTIEQFQQHMNNWIELYKKSFGSEPSIQEFTEYTTFLSTLDARSTYQRQQREAIADSLKNQ
jgi:hypothetical protein